MSDNSSFKKPQHIQQTMPMREFNVTNPDDDVQYDTPIPQQHSVEEIEHKMRQARKEKIAGYAISEAAKQRVKILIGIASHNKDVSVGECVFSIRTLKAGETREAAKAAFNSTTQVDASFEARRQQLARAITHIDGNDINLVIDSNTLDGKLELIDNLEEIVVNKLWDEFVSLKENASKKFGINTPQEAKEVIDDLKK